MINGSSGKTAAFFILIHPLDPVLDREGVCELRRPQRPLLHAALDQTLGQDHRSLRGVPEDVLKGVADGVDAGLVHLDGPRHCADADGACHQARNKQKLHLLNNVIHFRLGIPLMKVK